MMYCIVLYKSGEEIINVEGLLGSRRSGAKRVNG